MSHETENGKPEEYTEVLKRFIQPKFEKALKSYMHADETSPKWRAFSDMVERDASEQLAREESDGRKKARYEARQWFYEDTIERESESSVYRGFRTVALNLKADVIKALKNAFDQIPLNENSMIRPETVLPESMSRIKRFLIEVNASPPSPTSPTTQGSTRPAERPKIIPFRKPTEK